MPPPARGHHASADSSTRALAFVAGLSVLVRPELALIGGLALVMMLIAARGLAAARADRRRRRPAAGGYQIFRMGYYGLLVPGTALAKDASGSKWPQGFVYLANFNQPYLLWAPAILLAGLGGRRAGHPRPAVADAPPGRIRLRMAGARRSRAPPQL